MSGHVLNTWAEILRHLGRSPGSGRARSEVRAVYGDLIHREEHCVWAVAEELTKRRHAQSRHLGKSPVKPPVAAP
jgi:hypothetical protein